jgi:putative ABC transport system substrate-binding protein
VTAAAEAAPNTPIVTAGGNPASMRLVSNFAWADKAEDIELAVTGLAKEGAQALIAGPSPFFTSERERIVRLALTHGLPVAGGASDWAEAGALFAYAADGEALWRRAAYYVDRILKGAKPGDLPIEQPMTFELVVNLKTAKALGLTMPPEILVRATRVIQ